MQSIRGLYLLSDEEAGTVVPLRYDCSNNVCDNSGLDEERRTDESQTSRVAVEQAPDDERSRCNIGYGKDDTTERVMLVDCSRPSRCLKDSVRNVVLVFDRNPS